MSERKSSPSKDLFFLALTGSRLLLAKRMVNTVKKNKNKSIFRDMVTFVCADVADGVLARRYGSETTQRRFADTLTDGLSVAWVSSEVARHNKAARPYAIGFALRQMIVSTVNGYHYLRTGELVQGTGVHKLGSLSMAAFGVAAAGGNKISTHVNGMATNVINGVLALNYIMNAIEPMGEVDNRGVRYITFK